MITIIVGCQLCHSLVEVPIVLCSQLIDFRLEITQDFFLGNTANGGIFWLKTDVAQIVEYREERDLRKLGDTCDEDKLLVFVISLEDGKNTTINSCTCFMLRSFPGMLQGRVVFVDENRHLKPGFIVCSLNDSIKTVGKRTVLSYSNIILRLKLMEGIVQIAPHTFRCSSCTTHIQPDDRTLHPFRLHLHDLQSLEEFLLA